MRAASSSQHRAVAERGGHRLDRGRVVEVAAGGHVGQQQVVAAQRDEHGGVGRVEPHARADPGQQLDADLGVVAGAALADVVEQGAEHEQVGPVDPAGQPGAAHRGLPQVPVDGEAVVGVALRLAAHAGPLGHVPLPHALLVERLEQHDGRRPGQQQVDERSAYGFGPGRRRVGGLGGQPGERPPVELGVAAGGGRRGRQGERGVGGDVDVVGDGDLAVLEAQAPAEVAGAPGPGQRPDERAVDAVPGVVARPGDRAGGPGDGAHQHVGVGVAEGVGQAVLLLQQHLSPGRPVRRCSSTRTASSVA